MFKSRFIGKNFYEKIGIMVKKSNLIKPIKSNLIKNG